MPSTRKERYTWLHVGGKPSACASRRFLHLAVLVYLVSAGTYMLAEMSVTGPRQATRRTLPLAIAIVAQDALLVLLYAGGYPRLRALARFRVWQTTGPRRTRKVWAWVVCVGLVVAIYIVALHEAFGSG